LRKVQEESRLFMTLIVANMLGTFQLGVKPGASEDPVQVLALSTCLASMVVYWFLMLHVWYTFCKGRDVESEEWMSIVSEEMEEEEEEEDTEEQGTEGTAGMWAETVGRARAQHADCCSRRAIARARLAHTESLDRVMLETCRQTRRPRSFDEHLLCSPVILAVTQGQDSNLPDLDEWMQELKRITRQRKHSGCENEDACPDVASMAKNSYPAGPSPADLFSSHSSSLPLNKALDKSFCMHKVNLQVIGSAPGSRDVSTNDLCELSTGVCEGSSAYAFTQQDSEIDGKVHEQLMELNALFASLDA